MFLVLVSRQSVALSSATQNEMPAECVGKMETECLSTKFFLPTLCCESDTS